MNLVTFTQDKAEMLAALLPVVKADQRIETDDQDASLTIYIGASIGAAENYLDRDVWPTQRGYSGPLEVASNVWSPSLPGTVPCGWKFDFRRGRVRSRAFTLAGSATAVTPTQTIESADPKTWGFIAYFAGDPGALDVTITSGYADVASMPEDLVKFILAACGMMSEVREMGNNAQVFPVDAYPVYLLGAWANPTFA